MIINVPYSGWKLIFLKVYTLSYVFYLLLWIHSIYFYFPINACKQRCQSNLRNPFLQRFRGSKKYVYSPDTNVCTECCSTDGCNRNGCGTLGEVLFWIREICFCKYILCMPCDNLDCNRSRLNSLHVHYFEETSN